MNNFPPPSVPTTIAAALRLLDRGYLSLVLVFLAARLPAIIFIVAMQTAAPSLPAQVTGANWSWPSLVLMLFLPAAGGLALTAYCELWSLVAVSRMLLARAGGADLPAREALALVAPATAARAWLLVLPLALPALAVVLAGVVRPGLLPFSGLAAGASFVVYQALLMVLAVGVADGGQNAKNRLPAFLALVLLLAVIELGNWGWHGLLPVMASRFFWLGMNLLGQVYYLLLLPVPLALAVALSSKAEQAAGD